GDIVGLDFGLIYRGFHTDAAITVPVGKISKEAQKLLQTTKESLGLGIEEVLIGNTVGDIGYVIQKYVEKKGFGVVKELVGHGVGRKLHEEPYVPNYGRKGEGEVLKEGMVIAIEPMITAGKPAVDIASDNWTYKTKDHSLAAHFEHTVAVTKEGPKVLT
ncbi:MAG: type I methionyl aminopeptidase, partial [Candidatus Yanofskybacteria bacterium RIFCSPLOWO2_02_FULL_43_10b]